MPVCPARAILESKRKAHDLWRGLWIANFVMWVTPLLISAILNSTC
jgi:hypothetical protein